MAAIYEYLPRYTIYRRGKFATIRTKYGGPIDVVALCSNAPRHSWWKKDKDWLRVLARSGCGKVVGYWEVTSKPF